MINKLKALALAIVTTVGVMILYVVVHILIKLVMILYVVVHILIKLFPLATSLFFWVVVVIAFYCMYYDFDKVKEKDNEQTNN